MSRSTFSNSASTNLAARRSLRLVLVTFCEAAAGRGTRHRQNHTTSMPGLCLRAGRTLTGPLLMKCTAASAAIPPGTCRAQGSCRQPPLDRPPTELAPRAVACTPAPSCPPSTTPAKQTMRPVCQQHTTHLEEVTDDADAALLHLTHHVPVPCLPLAVLDLAAAHEDSKQLRQGTSLHQAVTRGRGPAGEDDIDEVRRGWEGHSNKPVSRPTVPGAGAGAAHTPTSLDAVECQAPPLPPVCPRQAHNRNSSSSKHQGHNKQLKAVCAAPHLVVAKSMALMAPYLLLFLPLSSRCISSTPSHSTKADLKAEQHAGRQARCMHQCRVNSMPADTLHAADGPIHQPADTNVPQAAAAPPRHHPASHNRAMCMSRAVYLLAGSSRHEQRVSNRFSMVSCSNSSTGSFDLNPARHTSRVSTPLPLPSSAWLGSWP